MARARIKESGLQLNGIQSWPPLGHINKFNPLRYLNIVCYSQITHWYLSYKSLRKSLKFKILVLTKVIMVSLMAGAIDGIRNSTMIGH